MAQKINQIAPVSDPDAAQAFSEEQLDPAVAQTFSGEDKNQETEHRNLYSLQNQDKELTGQQMVNTVSSAALAFLGDSVFELYIRNRVVSGCEGGSDELNRRSKALTNAKAQAMMANELVTQMSGEELAVYKRGRNLKSLVAPRSCSISEYRRATGIEALMGFLFLMNRQDRIRELIEAGIRALEEAAEEPGRS